MGQMLAGNKGTCWALKDRLCKHTLLLARRATQQVGKPSEGWLVLGQGSHCGLAGL